jgi:uncharacterized protein YndB with AHSA1/START domain
MSEPTPTPEGPDTPEVPRTIDLSIEIDATPEQVWQAIATGPGISAWFVPARVDDHVGGKLHLSFGDIGEETAVLTTLDAPHRLVATFDQDAPETSALELLVAARDGGSCVVRLVQSGFGTGDKWDDEIDQTIAGWKAFLHNLKLYVTRFAPRPPAMIFSHGGWAGPHAEGWDGLLRGLGLPTVGEGLAVGRRVATSDAARAAGAPHLAGTVDRLVGGTATLLIEEPAPGYAIVSAEGPDGGVFLNISAYIFGDDAPAVAERETPRWVRWMADHFAHPEGTSSG